MRLHVGRLAAGDMSGCTGLPAVLPVMGKPQKSAAGAPYRKQTPCAEKPIPIRQNQKRCSAVVGRRGLFEVSVDFSGVGRQPVALGNIA